MKKLEEAVRKELEEKVGKDSKRWIDEKVIISMPTRKEKENERMEQ